MHLTRRLALPCVGGTRWSQEGTRSLDGIVYPPVAGLARIHSEASLLAPGYSLFYDLNSRVTGEEEGGRGETGGRGAGKQMALSVKALEGLAPHCIVSHGWGSNREVSPGKVPYSRGTVSPNLQGDTHEGPGDLSTCRHYPGRKDVTMTNSNPLEVT